MNKKISLHFNEHFFGLAVFLSAFTLRTTTLTTATTTTTTSTTTHQLRVKLLP
jgi:hypothetical protein